MKIERLNGLRHKIVFQEVLDLDDGSDREIITDLIDAEIARQSVTDEAVREAIEWLEPVRDHAVVPHTLYSKRERYASLAIQALSHMKPVELCEGCRPNKLYCEVYAEGKLWDKGWASFCPSCGRALKDGE